MLGSLVIIELAKVILLQRPSMQPPLFNPSEWAFLLEALDLTPKADMLKMKTTRPCQTVGSNRAKRKCQHFGCPNMSHSRNLCKRHGGGSRCKVPNCSKLSKNRGVCHAHGGGTPCSVDGCTKGRQKRGLCAAHGGLDQCQVLNCTNRARGHGSCRRHEIAMNGTLVT